MYSECILRSAATVCVAEVFVQHRAETQATADAPS
jgi:hypothetical protein